MSDGKEDSVGRGVARADIAPVSFCRRSDRKYMSASIAARGTKSISHWHPPERSGLHSVSVIAGGLSVSEDLIEALSSSFPTA